MNKIISGGQHGADLGGLHAARDFKIKTGGWAPRGWMTCQGPNLELENLGLIETQSTGYSNRTKKNVIDSDATLIIATNLLSPGTKQTRFFCKQFEKPYFEIDRMMANDELISIFSKLSQYDIINIAGNRDNVGEDIHYKLAYNITKELILFMFSNHQ